MQIAGLLLDVEGVLVVDKRYQAVPGGSRFISQARQADCPLRLITNNTTDKPANIITKLTNAGYNFTPAELHTCTSAAVRLLREQEVRRCLVIGGAALREMVTEAGIAVIEAADVDAVVVGTDTELTYARLQVACEAVLRHDARLIALHHNRIFDDAQGRPAPSVGALSAAIEYATGATPTVVGKPSADYFRLALADLGVLAEEALVVSDDPFSDLAGAKRLGMHAALVLSGKYRDAEIVQKIPLDERPDVIAADIGTLVNEGLVTF